MIRSIAAATCSPLGLPVALDDDTPCLRVDQHALARQQVADGQPREDRAAVVVALLERRDPLVQPLLELHRGVALLAELDDVDAARPVEFTAYLGGEFVVERDAYWSTSTTPSTATSSFSIRTFRLSTRSLSPSRRFSSDCTMLRAHTSRAMLLSDSASGIDRIPSTTTIPVTCIAVCWRVSDGPKWLSRATIVAAKAMASVLVRNRSAAPSAKSIRPVTSPKATVEQRRHQRGRDRDADHHARQLAHDRIDARDPADHRDAEIEQGRLGARASSG